MCLTEEEDAGKTSKLFETIEESFEANEIPWNNCASLSVDNTNAMEESSTLWHQDSCRKIPTYLLEVALVIQHTSQQVMPMMHLAMLYQQMWKLFVLIVFIGLTKAQKERESQFSTMNFVTRIISQF